MNIENELDAMIGNIINLAAERDHNELGVENHDGVANQIFTILTNIRAHGALLPYNEQPVIHLHIDIRNALHNIYNFLNAHEAWVVDNIDQMIEIFTDRIQNVPPHGLLNQAFIVPNPNNMNNAELLLPGHNPDDILPNRNNNNNSIGSNYSINRHNGLSNNYNGGYRRNRKTRKHRTLTTRKRRRTNRRISYRHRR